MISRRKTVIASVLVISLSLAIGCGAWAQERFLAGGGPMAVALALDLRSLNAYLPGAGFTGDFVVGGSAVFVLSGGGGFLGNKLRIGGVGAERSWTTPLKDAQFDRAEFSFKYDGFLIEWAGTGISLGGILSSGTLSLRLSKLPSGGFASVIAQPQSLELRRKFFIVQPYLSTEFKLISLLGLRLEVGFLFGISQGDWKLSDGTKVPGGPLGTLSAPAFSIMLVVGG